MIYGVTDLVELEVEEERTLAQTQSVSGLSGCGLWGGEGVSTVSA